MHQNIPISADDQKFMNIAYAEAKQGFEQGGIPIVSSLPCSVQVCTEHTGCSPCLPRRPGAGERA